MPWRKPSSWRRAPGPSPIPTSVRKSPGPSYKNGTIGLAKNDLERAAKAIDTRLRASGGSAVISVNKALVTQASSAIPVVPLSISILYKIMKAKGTHEETLHRADAAALRATQLYAPGGPKPDEGGRVRVDDWEMRSEVQDEVKQIWPAASRPRPWRPLTDYRRLPPLNFLQLFGFGRAGVDYNAEVEPHVPML